MKGMKQQTVGILIFNEVEVLDFCGPLEVFTIAELYGQDDRDGQVGETEPNGVTKPFTVVTIALTREMVRCRGGLLVQPHYSIDDHPQLDILVIPGGQGTLRLLTNGRVLDWITAQHDVTPLITSVCTGAFLLAACDLLEGRSATTHWGGIEALRQNYPSVDVREDVRCVDSGNIITSAGVSAGIDMALYVVSRMYGEEIARQTARRMEYEWLEHRGALSYVRDGSEKQVPVQSSS